MKAELQKIFNLFEELEEAGETVTLTFASRGGKSTVKLQLESSTPHPSPSQTSPPAPGHRRRHRAYDEEYFFLAKKSTFFCKKKYFLLQKKVLFIAKKSNFGGWIYRSRTDI